jgi:maleylacetoacetate isomerase
VKLYEGWRSSASWRVRWGLAIKGVAYERVLVDLQAGEHHTALAPVNPMRQVPTLVLDDGRVLTESVAILEWLDETHPLPRLLPEDPYLRARVRALVQVVNSGIHPLQNSKVRAAISDDAAAQNAWCARWIVAGLAAYEEHAAELAGRYSVGDTLTLADLYLVPQVRNAQRFGADISALTRVTKIYDACLELPSARASDPEGVKPR